MERSPKAALPRAIPRKKPERVAVAASAVLPKRVVNHRIQRTS